MSRWDCPSNHSSKTDIGYPCRDGPNPHQTGKKRATGMSLHYWFLFLEAVLIATIAMASGVGGATFFSPLFIQALGLPPEITL